MHSDRTGCATIGHVDSVNGIWPAPVATGPVRATVPVDGSKSMTNRALLLAALADGPSTVHHPLRSRDTDLMVAALRTLGTTVTAAPDEPGALRIVPWLPAAATGRDLEIDCGLAGTVMRFMPPAAALADGRVRFDGDPRARERPMHVMVNALCALGVDVSGDALPFMLTGTGRVPGGEVTIDASASSQFISGLLLSAARYDRGAAVHHDGKPVPSLPHIEMTVQMLRAHGVQVDEAANSWRVYPGPIAARDWTIEPDLSNASVYLAAAAATGGEVTVPGWPADTTQAGDAIAGILELMGCRVTRDSTGLTVAGPDRLAAVDVDLHDVGELTPTVAALCTLAGGTSVLRGIAHLRGHETDRLAALAKEINGLGGDAEETADGLVIRHRRLGGGRWHAYADHRMATAGAVIGLVVPGVQVDDIGCTRKTISDFPGNWTAAVTGAGLVDGGRH